jgi:hypothetical protein
MRPLVVGERRNAGNVGRHRAGVLVSFGTTLAAVAVALSGAVAGCGSVSNGLPKNDAGTGGSAGSGTGGATGSGGAPSAGGAPGTGGAAMTMDASADVADAPREGGAGCTGVQASCAAIHACDATALSGNYMIAPDGPTDAAPVLVFCDMTLGGGWTVIYLADNINLNSTTIPYTVTSQKLRDNSTQALIAFRNLNLNLVASDTAVFDLPAAWRASNPLTATPPQDLTLSASVNGGLPAVAKLRYGVANFGSLCGDDWNTVSNYGRICLQDTAAAFYSGFSTTAGDFCALSTNAYSSRACSDMIRFSIAVR